jgi:RNA polymerase sigma-70 factor (ECF subfamily)
VVAKETIELTFLTAIQRLQPLPRAVFILRDVLDCSAKETAELLETTVASVNSALQRAHAGLREHLPEPARSGAPSRSRRPPSGSCSPATSRPASRPTRGLRRRHARRRPLLDAAPARGVGGPRHRRRGWVEGGFGLGRVRVDALRGHAGQPAARGRVLRPAARGRRAPAARHRRPADRGRLVREIVTFDGSLFGRFDLPASLPASARPDSGGRQTHAGPMRVGIGER